MTVLSEKSKALQSIFERLGWGYTERNDNLVAARILEHQEVDEVHNLNEGGILDGFMEFLENCGFMEYLAGMSIEARQRNLLPIICLLLTYIAKTLYNIESVYQLPELLFSDEGIMKILGFNGWLLENGLSRRSEEKRSTGKEAPKPFCPQMLANLIGALSVKEAEQLFNAAIACLARFGVFPRRVVVVIDGTDIETTEKCTGAGKRSKTKVIRNVETSYLAYGFKAVVLYELSTQLPIAVKVGKINRHDSRFTYSLLNQAEQNLAGLSKVTKVIADRGFIDGRMMWRLDQRGITFVCPAKKNMNVYKDAQSLAAAGKGVVHTRKREVFSGYGKKRTVNVLETEVIGISSLTTWDQYNDPDLVHEKNRRDYSPRPINAVVVRKWDNRDYGPGGNVIYLTNAPVAKPFTIFDSYDCRSLIENTLFREGKQAWSLENIPKKTQKAAVAHIFITFATLALSTAYRTQGELEADQDDLVSPVPTEATGIRKWRRKLLEQNRDRVIVFCGNFYGIYHIAEFTTLTGFRIRKLPPEVGTIKDIYYRYGLTPPD